MPSRSCVYEIKYVLPNTQKPHLQWNNVASASGTLLCESPHVRESNYWIPVFIAGTWILDSSRKWDSRFLERYLEFQSPGFQIPQVKFTQRPESGFPYMGRLCASYHLKGGILNFEIKTCAAFYSFMKWHLIVTISNVCNIRNLEQIQVTMCQHYIWTNVIISIIIIIIIITLIIIIIIISIIITIIIIIIFIIVIINFLF